MVSEKEQTELFGGTWSVSEDGHEWEDPDHGTVLSNPRLVLKNKLWVPRKPYYPLEAATLFGEFADLPPTQDAVLQFANQYGFLREIRGPELLSEWEHEIRSLSQAVLLWEWLKDRKTKELERFVTWEGDTLIAPTMYDERTKTSRKFILSTLPVKSLLELDKKPDKPGYWSLGPSFKPGDVRKPIRALIEDIVSRRFDQEIRAAFGGGEIYMSTRSLIGAMWFQFAEAFAGRTEYIRCVVCRHWIRLKEKAKGKGKIYCSNRCKQVAKRQKLKQKLRSKRRTKR
jgi:hypothetical protein